MNRSVVITIETNENANQLSAQVLSNRIDTVFLFLNSGIGFDAAAVWFTSDSVLIYDRLEDTWYNYALSSPILLDIFGFQPRFEDLLRVTGAKMNYPDSIFLTGLIEETEHYLLLYSQNQTREKLWISRKYLKPVKWIRQARSGQIEWIMEFSNFSYFRNEWVPKSIILNDIQHQQTLSLFIRSDDQKRQSIPSPNEY